MVMNALYNGPSDCPAVLPLFPLPGALLLPRSQIPLNIFEPRYLTLVDDALRGNRLIGMIQPDGDASDPVQAAPRLYTNGCAGRITQFTETGDGRCLITLTGVARFRVTNELSVMTPYRQCSVDFTPFLTDFTPRTGEADVDRQGLVDALRDFAKATEMGVDWDGVQAAPTEALVNALAMMSPFGIREKQALLEAENLRSRADMLVVMTQMELARRDGDSGKNTMQ
jgi:uncharacterized protein